MEESISKTFSDAAQSIEQSAEQANRFLTKLADTLEDLAVK